MKTSIQTENTKSGFDRGKSKRKSKSSDNPASAFTSKLMNAAVIASLMTASIASAPMAFAAKGGLLPTTPAQLPSTQGFGRPSVYHVNVNTLLADVMSGDNSVLTELNSVYQAKESLNIARGNLLPSINPSALFSGSPTFLISEISFLLPFLLPSNWFNLKAAERQLAAEGDAFYVVELNEFASAYTAYQTVVRDMNLRDVLQEEADIAKKIEVLVSQQVMVGQAAQVDLRQATAQAQVAQVQVVQTDELIRQETAVIRKMMGFPLDQTIVIDPNTVAVSRFESGSTMTAAQYAYSKSPERDQLESLVRASQNSTWSAGFAFITGATLSTTSQGSSSANFGKIQAGVSVSLGFANYPAVKLNEVNTNYYRTEALGVQLEISRIVETSIESIKDAKTAVDGTTQAENNYRIVLQGRQQEYGIGQTDLLHLLDAQTDVSNTAIKRVQAQLDLDSQRINLHRTTISEHFANINGCNLKENNGGGWLEGLFAGPSSDMHTIDQLCHAQPAALQATASLITE